MERFNKEWEASNFILPYKYCNENPDNLSEDLKKLLVELPKYEKKKYFTNKLTQISVIALLVIIGIGGGIIAAMFTSIAVVGAPIIIAAAFVLGAFLLPVGVMYGIGSCVVPSMYDRPQPLTEKQCEAIIAKYDSNKNPLHSARNVALIKRQVEAREKFLKRLENSPQMESTIPGRQIYNTDQKGGRPKTQEEWDLEVAQTYSGGSYRGF
jgi:hypothetical protein